MTIRQGFQTGGRPDPLLGASEGEIRHAGLRSRVADLGHACGELTGTGGPASVGPAVARRSARLAPRVGKSRVSGDVDGAGSLLRARSRDRASLREVDPPLALATPLAGT